MAVAATLTISGTKTGLPSGSGVIGPLTVTNNASTGQVTEVALSSGDNTITAPSATVVGCVIQPAAGNTQALRLKGAGGDTGILLHLTNPHVQSLGTGQSSFIINAAGVTSAEVNWF